MGLDYPFFNCLDFPQVQHPLLASAGEKVRWAEIHLEALQRNIWNHFTTPANRIPLRADLDPNTGYHFFRIKELPDYSGFHTNVALGVGDVVGNLRAALDHAIFGIIYPRRASHPKFDEWGIGFPVCDNATKLRNNRAYKAIWPFLTSAEQKLVLL